MDNKSIAKGVDIAQTRKGAAVSLRPSLSDTALVLLSAAANREGGTLLPPPAELKTRGGALKVVLARLLARGIVEEMPVGSDAESWRRGDASGRVGLRITPTGRAAIGVEAEGDGDSVTEPASDEPDEAELASETRRHAAGTELSVELDADTDATTDPIDGTIVWTSHDPHSNVGTADNAAIADTDAGAASPRRRSKQDRVVALLSREIGVSIHALTAATGWLPHTVRAVLSGLRKKGYRIDRQRQDDGGSIYRIMPSPIVDTEPAASDTAS